MSKNKEIKRLKDMDFKPTEKDVIEVNLEKGYAIFKQKPRTRFRIDKRKSKIRFTGESFGWNITLI